MTDWATEARYWRGVAENLRADLAECREKLRRADGGHRVMFDLWCREVRPGWRMWRIRRRRQAALLAHTCPHCGATSFHADDVSNRYCGRCHHFCDQADLIAELAAQEGTP